MHCARQRQHVLVLPLPSSSYSPDEHAPTVVNSIVPVPPYPIFTSTLTSTLTSLATPSCTVNRALMLPLPLGNNEVEKGRMCVRCYFPTSTSTSSPTRMSPPTRTSPVHTAVHSAIQERHRPKLLQRCPNPNPASQIEERRGALHRPPRPAMMRSRGRCELVDEGTCRVDPVDPDKNAESQASVPGAVRAQVVCTPAAAVDSRAPPHVTPQMESALCAHEEVGKLKAAAAARLLPAAVLASSLSRLDPCSTLPRVPSLGAQERATGSLHPPAHRPPSPHPPCTHTLRWAQAHPAPLLPFSPPPSVFRSHLRMCSACVNHFVVE
ncbi:hypothetical protein B0H16DRAFT_1728327 [Mycena metata]|uniref:Uncharacterized protein n=1 Tax=Mycena metata TaxID=1033252 RepID=A0AAD7IH45_9AGAR|nr:hypothetical protein B0H16DRAFT_1728327 [Mycena metata]